MRAKPTLAVILAAGRGTRFGPTGKVQPKGFIKIDDQPIIARSVQLLQRHGIREIIIVTGHCREHYVKLASEHPDLIRLVHNKSYAESGSMYSLFTAQSTIGDRPFLLLESDLIYESSALPTLLDHPSDDVLLVSGPTDSGDEVYVSAVGDKLTGLSKQRSALSAEPYGELVGISKLSPSFYSRMCNVASETFASTLHLEYEEAMVTTARTLPMTCHLVADLVWSEIDSQEHLARVNSLILPRLKNTG